MAGWLARKVGLAVEAHGDVGTDHTGREIPTSRVEHAGVAIDGWGEIADGPMLVTEIPEPVAKLGIGMFLSPQSLGQGAAVVLDLAGRQMYLASYAEAERQIVARGRAISPAGGIACVDTASPIRGLAYVIPAEVERRPVNLLVDTGAERTDLLVGTPAAAALASRSVANKDPLYAASGRIRTRMVHGARVKVGEWSRPVDIDLIPGTTDAFCPREGVLSMDVLASCVLVLGPGRMLGRCSP
jgi:predicted aspartyl protease